MKDTLTGESHEHNKPLIILIEDDYSSRLVLETFLRDKGYALKSFNKPPHPDEMPPDSVLMVDVRIAGKRAAGIDFVLKLPEEKINLPLIFISNWGRDRIKSDLSNLTSRRHKPFSWLDKPIELDLLEGEIDKAISC